MPFAVIFGSHALTFGGGVPGILGDIFPVIAIVDKAHRCRWPFVAGGFVVKFMAFEVIVITVTVHGVVRSCFQKRRSGTGIDLFAFGGRGRDPGLGKVSVKGHGSSIEITVAVGLIVAHAPIAVIFVVCNVLVHGAAVSGQLGLTLDRKRSAPCLLQGGQQHGGKDGDDGNNDQ